MIKCIKSIANLKLFIYYGDANECQDCGGDGCNYCEGTGEAQAMLEAALSGVIYFVTNYTIQSLLFVGAVVGSIGVKFFNW